MKEFIQKLLEEMQPHNWIQGDIFKFNPKTRTTSRCLMGHVLNILRNNNDGLDALTYLHKNMGGNMADYNDTHTYTEIINKLKELQVDCC